MSRTISTGTGKSYGVVQPGASLQTGNTSGELEHIRPSLR